jgi:hypothetical protein
LFERILLTPPRTVRKLKTALSRNQIFVGYFGISQKGAKKAQKGAKNTIRKTKSTAYIK